MSDSPALLLVGAVATVGILHTIVPDHWVPITLMARQRGWTRAETARTAFKAGVGHVLSTLVIAAIVWLAGVAAAQRFGHGVDTIASLALIGFGLWIAVSAWRDLHTRGAHPHRTRIRTRIRTRRRTRTRMGPQPNRRTITKAAQTKARTERRCC